jgi:hypothetical protein
MGSREVCPAVTGVGARVRGGCVGVTRKGAPIAASDWASGRRSRGAGDDASFPAASPRSELAGDYVETITQIKRLSGRSEALAELRGGSMGGR